MKKSDEISAFRKFVNGLPCAICRNPPPSDGHHVKSVGSGGVDKENLIPLCRFCHSKLHHYGPKRIEAALQVSLRQIAYMVWDLWTQENET